MRGSQAKISYSDQIPKELILSRLQPSFSRRHQFVRRQLLSFSGSSESWTVCFQMPLTVPYASFSAGCRLVLQKALRPATKAGLRTLK